MEERIVEQPAVRNIFTVIMPLVGGLLAGIGSAGPRWLQGELNSAQLTYLKFHNAFMDLVPESLQNLTIESLPDVAMIGALMGFINLADIVVPIEERPISESKIHAFKAIPVLFWCGREAYQLLAGAPPIDCATDAALMAGTYFLLEKLNQQFDTIA